jgi:pre-mRNA-processing factor 17
MSLVAGYESKSGDETQTPSVPAHSAASTCRATAAAALHTALKSPEDPMQLKQMLIKPSDKQLSYNISYADMTRPLAGPVNPFKPDGPQTKNLLTGFAEAQEMSEAAFRTQNRTFQALGYARNPSLHD